MPVELPIFDGNRRTGRTVEVPEPPPERWEEHGVTLELATVDECRRFGCGCIWEKTEAYRTVRPATNEGSEE